MRWSVVALFMLTSGAWSAAAAAAPWPEVEARVRPALARHLSAAELDRLLARDDVRALLRDTFGTWDGADDRLEVSRDSGGAVTVRVVTAARQTACHAPLVEGGAAEPICESVVAPVADVRAVLEPDLWRAPRRAPRPAPPPEPPPPEAEPGPSETVLRVTRDDAPAVHPEVAAAFEAYEGFQQGLKHRYWTDPFLPHDLTESGTALFEPERFEPPGEAAVEGNLRDPFSEGRLGAKLELPVPAHLRLARDGTATPLVAPVTEPCLAEWALRDAGTTPPSLDCYRRVTQNTRLERGVFYQLVKGIEQVLGFRLSLPILDQLVEAEMRAAASLRGHNVIWAAVWLEWAAAAPDERISKGLADLTDEERRLLRRRLWRWWIAPDLAPYRALITTVYERHFLGLYPEASDAAGLPKRTFFNDTWLWASNWLSAVGDRPAPAIRAAYDRLGPRERAVIDAFAHEPLTAARFPGPTAVLRRR